MIITRLHCDVDLEWDRFSVGHPPHHLDPGEKGMSSGRTPLGASAYLVVEDLGEIGPAKEREASTASGEGALSRDKITDLQLGRIAITHRLRYRLVSVLGRSE